MGVLEILPLIITFMLKQGVKQRFIFGGKLVHFLCYITKVGKGVWFERKDT